MAVKKKGRNGKMASSEMGRMIEQHMNDIFRYAVFLTGDRNTAKDLMQDAILRAMRKKHLYKEKSSFRSWIFTIMKRVCINSAKKIVHEPYSFSELSRDGNFNENIIEFRSEKFSSESMSDPLLRSKIINAMSSIPLKYREIVYYIDVLEKSYEETAQELDVPVGTVMSRLYRSRRMLRSKLSQAAAELKIIDKNRNREERKDA